MKFDAVIIGGGKAGFAAACKLQEAGKKCAVIARGRSLRDTERFVFVECGGTVLNGDVATGGVWDGPRLVGVTTRNLAPTLLEADNFILATGKFFSKGLVATMDKVTEPVFGSDVEFDEDRTKWFNPDFYGQQPFELFGVKTDGEQRVSIGGVISENLYAAGEILAGIGGVGADNNEKIEQSAIAAAQRILEK